MRKSKKCPECECTKILVIQNVADSGGSGSGHTPARLAIRHEGYSFMGNEKKTSVGDLNAVMCSECGYTEFYCVNPQAVQPDNKLITWL
jgi:predicted nucleic-acid-binding Zn-ribbon protein